MNIDLIKKRVRLGIKISIFLGILSLVLGIILYLSIPSYKLRKNSETGIHILEQSEGYRLMKDSEVFQINGVAGSGYLSELKQMKGNTIRLYRYFVTEDVLNEADSLGISVVVDLNLPGALEKFDYGNEKKLDSLIEDISNSVRVLKKHSSIIIWNIGNEPVHFSLGFWRRREAWQAIDKISRTIQEIDPDRLTSIAVPFGKKFLIYPRLFAPSLDILGVNAFKMALSEAKFSRFCFPCWDGPFLYSEFGPQGTWQSLVNNWGVPIELSDLQKKDHLTYMFETFKQAEPKCLGAFAFYWGNKQERTHSWYSLFTLDGEKTPVVDELSKIWTGDYVGNRSPIIENLTLNQLFANENVSLEANEIYSAESLAKDPENDSIQLTWEILREGDYMDKFYGTKEARPEIMTDLIVETVGNTVRFRAPREPGPYRLFVSARDNNDNCSTFNFPFFVVIDAF